MAQLSLNASPQQLLTFLASGRFFEGYSTPRIRLESPRFIDPFVNAGDTLKLATAYEQQFIQPSGLSRSLEVSVIQENWHKSDPYNLKAMLIQREDPIKVTYGGGLGDLTTRFLAQGQKELFGDFPELKNKIQITVVDKRDPEDEKTRSRIQEVETALGISIRYLTEEQFLEEVKADKKNSPDLFVISSPNNVHIENLKALIEHCDLNKTFVTIEKPACLPSQLPEFKKLVAGMPPGSISCTDFYHSASSSGHGLNTIDGLRMFNQIGRIRAITGNCIESQEVEITRLVPPNEPLTQANDFGLRRPGVGDGMFSDCVIHNDTEARMTIDNYARRCSKGFFQNSRGFLTTHAYNGSYDWRRDLYGTFASYRSVSEDGQTVMIMQGGKGIGVNQNAYNVTFLEKLAHFTMIMVAFSLHI